MAEVTKRQEFAAQLVGELLAFLIGLWITFRLEWRELGPLVMLFGAGGFVVTCVRRWTTRNPR